MNDNNTLEEQENNMKDLIAIILCAGEGTRIRSDIDNIPKPLIKLRRLNNNPILYDTIYKLLKLNSLKSVIIITGYLKKKIKEFLVSLKKFDSSIRNTVKIHNSKQEYKKGPLYSFLSITRYKNMFKNQRLVVIPGDTIFDFSLLNITFSIIGSNESNCILFFRETNTKTLNNIPSNEISIIEVEEDIDIIVKRISQLPLSSIGDLVIVKQLIPIISIDYDLLSSLPGIADKYGMKTLRDIINKIIKQKIRVTAHKVDSAYNFYDIDTIEDKEYFEQL